jgi:hypothetical protein
MGMSVQRHAPAVLLPENETPVPTVQEAGPDAGVACTGAENLVPSPAPALRFDPLTVQPVTSRYTDVAWPGLAYTVVWP